MSSAKEFREYARECLDWAKTARTERERAIFMQMAETWIDAALRLEPEVVRLIDKVAVEPEGRQVASDGTADSSSTRTAG
jgi:hypothetical protein